MSNGMTCLQWKRKGHEREWAVDCSGTTLEPESGGKENADKKSGFARGSTHNRRTRY